jgi:hypothetical protein
VAITHIIASNLKPNKTMKTKKYLTISLEGYKPFSVELVCDEKISDKYTCYFHKLDPNETADEQPNFIDFFKTNGFSYWRQQDGTICFKPNAKGNEMFCRYIWMIWHQIHIKNSTPNSSISWIPENIGREHILNAMAQIDEEGVSINRAARKYEIVYAAKKYPPKLLIEYANVFANGNNLIEGVSTHQANGYLTKLGFTVVPKQ